MKFSGRDRLNRLRRALFPTEAERDADHEARLAAMEAEVEAELAARRLAREAEATELRHGCADRLRPHIGGLVLVTSFRGVRPKENADRIRDAVLTPAHFGAKELIGASAILSYGRSNHEPLMETAGALAVSFQNRIGERAFLLLPQLEDSNLWLLSLVRAAEDTSRRANLPPERVGCIAAVSALNMSKQVDIPEPDPGTAFKLIGISEEARFGWEVVSMPNEQESF